MKKIKVLHISEPFVSGIYTYIKNIVNFSSNHNINSVVIYSGKRLETNIEYVKAEFDPQTTFVRVDMEREISFLKDITSLFKIIQNIKKIKPDVIHLHSSKAGVLGRIASVFYPNIKFFYTPNGFSFIREDISETKKKVFKFIEFIIASLFGGTIIACGDQEFAESKKLSKTLLVRNGVFVNDIANSSKTTNNDKLAIGTSGRISIQKNPKLFNDIALSLPDFHFIWIGEGELRDELFAKNIIITGWKKGNEAIEEVNKLDVFISTSLWEGLPFNIIEAMVLSKPILSNNIKANLPTIKQNENGFICNNVEEFVSSIKKLEDKVIRDKFGKESFKIANELFNLEKNFIDLIKLYTEK
jgi:glycosyltransferase involved in cell wall biosynthesis